MKTVYMCELCNATYVDQYCAESCEKTHKPKETMKIKNILYKKRQMGPIPKIPEYVTIEFSEKGGDHATYELKEVGYFYEE